MRKCNKAIFKNLKLNKKTKQVVLGFLLGGEEGNIVGQIINVNADEKVLNENGKVDPKKLHLITFDSIGNTYIELGEKVGNAFKDGLKIKNK